MKDQFVDFPKKRTLGFGTDLAERKPQSENKE